ncbi:MAG: Trigger factor [Acidobacteria bacterium]|nr:Trigger factor [Acidobacteriota bacterium]
MKTELIDVSPTRKEIKIEIDSAIVRDAYDRVSDKYSKLANVPGFRKGHAPRSVVRTRYKGEIRGEVLQELVPEAINEAIQEHSLETIGEPDVHLDNDESLQKFGAEPISVHVKVEVLPRVELGEYKGIPLTRAVRPVADADIDRIVEGLRENSASLIPVEDRGAQLGDTVTVNFNGKFVDTPEAEDINVDDVEVVLGGDGVQQEFTDNLLDTKPDDEKTFRVDYSPDFTSKGLAGKRVDYTAKVSAVRRKELPELDDEWAASLNEEFDSLATLRTRIREDLEARAGTEADHRLRTEVMRKLAAQHPFEVPATLIDHQTTNRLEAVVRDMIGRGIDPRNSELNWEGAREELRGQAEDDVRGSMLLERIAEEENLEVSEEEIEAEIEAIAMASRQTKEQIQAALTKEGGDRSIASRLRNRKALDFLVENASVTESEWQEPELVFADEPEATSESEEAE